MSMELTRLHLLGGDGTVKVENDVQTSAWDRLRRVCRELDCEIPSWEQLEMMHTSRELSGEGNDEIVLVVSNADGKCRRVNFNHGYVLHHPAEKQE